MPICYLGIGMYTATILHYYDQFSALLSCIQVRRDHVDAFTPGKLLPYCQLQLQWRGKCKPVALCHRVTLVGAKTPYNFITLESNLLQISTMEQGE